MNPYEPPQSSLEHEPAKKQPLLPDEEPFPIRLLLKFVSFCVLLLCELCIGLLFLDQLFVAWEIYGSPLLPGSDHLTPRNIVTCFVAIGLLMHWLWRSMD